MRSKLYYALHAERPNVSAGARSTEVKGRILIIDDNDAVRAAHERILSLAGYEVRAAAAPFEGLEATRDWAPDLILLDLIMPTISGFEAAKVFKAKTATRKAALIAFSGTITDDEAERYRRIGFDGILPKPLSNSELVERIEQLLARRPPSKS